MIMFVLFLVSFYCHASEPIDALPLHDIARLNGFERKYYLTDDFIITQLVNESEKAVHLYGHNRYTGDEAFHLSEEYGKPQEQTNFIITSDYIFGQHTFHDIKSDVAYGYDEKIIGVDYKEKNNFGIFLWDTKNKLLKYERSQELSKKYLFISRKIENIHYSGEQGRHEAYCIWIDKYQISLKNDTFHIPCEITKNNTCPYYLYKKFLLYKNQDNEDVFLNAETMQEETDTRETFDSFDLSLNGFFLEEIDSDIILFHMENLNEELWGCERQEKLGSILNMIEATTEMHAVISWGSKIYIIEKDTKKSIFLEGRCKKYNNALIVLGENNFVTVVNLNATHIEDMAFDIPYLCKKVLGDYILLQDNDNNFVFEEDDLSCKMFLLDTKLAQVIEQQVPLYLKELLLGKVDSMNCPSVEYNYVPGYHIITCREKDPFDYHCDYPFLLKVYNGNFDLVLEKKVPRFLFITDNALLLEGTYSFELINLRKGLDNQDYATVLKQVTKIINYGIQVTKYTLNF